MKAKYRVSIIIERIDNPDTDNEISTEVAFPLVIGRSVDLHTSKVLSESVDSLIKTLKKATS